MITTFLIAVSLAMDAFAVSVTSGLTVRNFSRKHALLLGVYFGGFQFLMPVLGWLLGSTIAEYVQRFSPWISFVLLGVIGGKMLLGAIRGEEEPEVPPELSHKRLFVLAVATSIDAMAVGISYAFSDEPIFLNSAVIGIVAFVISYLGGMLGGKLGDRFQSRAESVGGLVLIGIGIKILLQGIL